MLIRALAVVTVQVVGLLIAPAAAGTAALGEGACCFSGGSCDIRSAADCAKDGGAYQGDESVCEPNACPLALEPFVDPLPIPAVAEPVTGTQGGEASYEIAITQGQQQFHRDLPPTTVWRYTGGTPGPVIEATTGLAGHGHLDQRPPR